MCLVSGGEAGMNPGSPAQAYTPKRVNSAPSHAGEDRQMPGLSGNPWIAHPKEPVLRDFPMAKSPPSNAGDVGSIPGRGN